MSETYFVALSHPVWSGASGNIGSDWIIGLYWSESFDSTTFVSWLYGSANIGGEAVIDPEELATELSNFRYGITLPNVVFSGGTLTGDATISGLFLDAVSSPYDFEGAGSELLCQDFEIAGEGAAPAYFEIASGAAVFAGDGVIGQDGSGTLVISGDDSSLLMSAFLTVGESSSGTAGAPGTSTLIVSDYGSVQANDEIDVGGITGSSGVLKVESGGKVASGGDLIVGTGGSGTVTVDDAIVQSGQLTVGNSGDGTLAISSGGTLLSAGPYDDLAIGSGSSGTVSVDGSGSLWKSLGQMGVGVNGSGILAISNEGSLQAANEIDVAEGAGSIGVLTIESGATATSSGTYDTVGGNAGADGTVSVTGVGSNWDLTPQLIIGNSGSGTLSVSNSASLQAADEIDVGENTGSTGDFTVESGGEVKSGGTSEPIGINEGAAGIVAVNGDGSQWTTTAELKVGGNGSGSLTVSNGAILQAGTSGSSNGISLEIGDGPTGVGEMTVSGPASVATILGRIGVGISGQGTLSVTGGAVVNSTVPTSGYYSVFLGNSVGSLGTIALAGMGSEINAAVGPLGVGVSGGGLLAISQGATFLAGASETLGTNLGNSVGSSGTVTVDGADSLLQLTGQVDIGGYGTGTLDLTNAAVMNAGSAASGLDGGFIIGLETGSSGAVTLDSGAVLTSYGRINVGRQGSGEALVDNGATMASILSATDIADGYFGLTIAYGVGGTGTLTVTGSDSTVQTNTNINVGQAGAGVLDVLAGATVSAGTFMDLGGGVTTSAGLAIVSVDGTGSTLNVGTSLTVGQAGSGTLTAGIADLSLTNGGAGSVLGSVSIVAGSTIAVDATSRMEIGGSGDVPAGTILVDEGAQISGAGSIVGNVVDNGTIFATGGTLTIAGSLSGDGTLDIAAGATLVVGGTLAYSMSDSFVGDGLLVLQQTLQADDTLEVGDGGTLDLQGGVGNADTIAFDGAGTLDIGDPPTPEVVTGFGTNDAIDFLGLPNLTTSAGFGQPGELDVYSGSNEKAEFIFSGEPDGFEYTLEPQDDGIGGTEIFVDTSTSVVQNPTTGNSIKWSFIQAAEGDELAPYVPVTRNKAGQPVSTGKAGVTVGYGVDLSQGPVTQAVLSTEFSNLDDDPNLEFLDNVTRTGTGNANVGPNSYQAYQDLLAFGPVGGTSSSATITQPAVFPGNKNISLLSVSITTQQAATLDTYAENTDYKLLVSAFNKASTTADFSDLPANVQTLLMDLDYNAGLANVENLATWTQVINYDPSLGINSPKTQAQLNKINVDLTSLNTNYAARASYDTDQLIQPLLVNPPGEEELEVGTPGQNDSVYAFQAVAGQPYYLDPSGSTTFTLTESSSSPSFSSILLPGESASSYLVSYLVSSTWSTPENELPLTDLSLPSGVNGIQVTLLDPSGDPTTPDPDYGFGFIVDFTSDGTFDGTVSPSTACFAEGTFIMTPYRGSQTGAGERRVELLKVGDCVQTMSGELRPIIWIGRTVVDCARHPKPDAVRPVCVRTGAFGPGQPHSDLFLSPDHAVFVDGVLIPVKHLINGTTIRQVARAQVTYWHVELDTHDVLLAEGMPCESYLDTGDRNTFENGDLTLCVHPEFAIRTWEAAGCAPLVVTGPEVERARALIAARQARSARRGPRRCAA